MSKGLYYACVAVVVCASPLVASAQVSSVERVSVTADGSQGIGASDSPSVTTDGRYVAFRSDDPTFAGSNFSEPNDTNGVSDIFLKDTLTGALTLISADSDHVAGDAGSGIGPASERTVQISGDGSYIVFPSDASTLGYANSNFLRSIALYSAQNGHIQRLSSGSESLAFSLPSVGPSVDDSGNFAVFSSTEQTRSDNLNFSDIFRRDIPNQTTSALSLNSTQESAANGDSTQAMIAPDGSGAVFTSEASDIISNDANGKADIFFSTFGVGHSFTTERVSVGPDGLEADGASSEPFVSNDGRYVVFTSEASNLVSIDSNGVSDIFLRDRALGITQLISVPVTGVSSNGKSFRPAVTDDGRYVVFLSDADNLVAADRNGVTDAFIRDRLLGITLRLSENSVGNGTQLSVTDVAVSRDGAFAFFSSADGSLVAGDTNGVSDIFKVRPSKILTPETSLDAPDVVVDGHKITVTMTRFAKAVLQNLGQAAARDISDARKPTAKKIKVQYQVTLRGTGSVASIRRKVITKKNIFTFKKVPSGTYRVRYQVLGVRGSRPVIRSKRSPTSSASVG